MENETIDDKVEIKLTLYREFKEDLENTAKEYGLDLKDVFRHSLGFFKLNYDTFSEGKSIAILDKSGNIERIISKPELYKKPPGVHERVRTYLKS